MGARREDLDRLEAVRRDLDQVIPVQPDAMIEMSGNPELHRKPTVYQPELPGKLATDSERRTDSVAVAIAAPG